MSRKIIENSRIHIAVQSMIGGDPDYRKTVDEVEKAVSVNNIVIVGMRQNPFPKKSCALLDQQGLSYHYMEYGSYFSEWKRRGALKMWTGWPTLPMIFVMGIFIGGFSDLKKLVDSGELKKMLGS